MAYNPFNIFRRNQKAIFAVITVFIMFTFVLSSGLGGGADFFDWLPRWLGSKSNKGDVMCSLDGSKIHSGELEKLRYQRVIANRYMSQAALYTRAALDAYVSERALQASPEVRKAIDQVNMQEQYLHLMGAQAPLAVQAMRSELLRVLALPGTSAQDKDLLRVKAAGLSLLSAVISSGGDQHYFGNSPNRSNRDLVNFMIWQKKADQLGIHFTTDDVKKLIDKEFYDFFQGNAQVRVQKDLAQGISGFNLNKCFEAIGEEFRVRAAQTALLGPAAHGGRGDKTFGGFPSFNPPYEVYEYYREQCSPTTYGAIPVPAINFLDKVPDPDESNREVQAELRELWNKYQNDEPNFAKDTPGFKEPRKVRIEYITASATDPFYVRKAEETLKNEAILAQARAMMVAPLLGVYPSQLYHARAFAEDPILAREYEFTVLGHKFDVSTRYSSPNIFLSQILSTSVVRPGVMVSAAGKAAGQALSLGNPMAALAGTVSASFAYETRDRVQAGVPAVLLTLGSIPGVGSDVLGTFIGKPVPGPLPGPALFANMMNGLAAYEVMLPKPLPLDALRAELTKKLYTEKAKELVKKDLEDFIKEVNRLSSDGKVRPSEKDKIAAIQKFITDFTTGPRFDSGLGLGLTFNPSSIPSRGMTVGGNKVPLSEWKLEDDPGLVRLVAAQRESLKASPHSSAYIPFANSFFWQGGDRRNPVSTIFQAAFYPEQLPQARESTSLEAKPQFVVWRAEEVPARLVASYDAAKPAVIAAWKRMKARELAKARAEAIANTIRTAGPTAPAVLPFTILDESNKLATEFAGNPTAQNRIVPFLIEGVSPLTTIPNPTASKGIFTASPPTPFAQLRPFQLPPSENVKYPSMEMLKELLDKRKDDPKTTFVVADEPKDIYYVVTLTERKPKSDLEFQTAVMTEDPIARMTGRGGVRDDVLGSFAEDARRKTIESVMGLLKKEFKYEETEEQKKKLDERRGSDQ